MRLSKEQVDAFYKSTPWEKCRELILSRDLGLCQKCLRTTGEPVPANTVHHVVHLRDDPSRAFDENNLISVCQSCHNKLHPEKRSKGLKDISKKLNFVEMGSNPEIF